MSTLSTRWVFQFITVMIRAIFLSKIIRIILQPIYNCQMPLKFPFGAFFPPAVDVCLLQTEWLKRSAQFPLLQPRLVLLPGTRCWHHYVDELAERQKYRNIVLPGYLSLYWRRYSS